MLHLPHVYFGRRYEANCQSQSLAKQVALDWFSLDVLLERSCLLSDVGPIRCTHLHYVQGVRLVVYVKRR